LDSRRWDHTIEASCSEGEYITGVAHSSGCKIYMETTMRRSVYRRIIVWSVDIAISTGEDTEIVD